MFQRNSLMVAAPHCHGQDDLPAAFWSRAIAFIIDIMLIGCCNVVAAFMVLFLVVNIDLFGEKIFFFSILWLFLLAVIPLLSGLCYFSAMHAWEGRTVGKMVMAIRLKPADGIPITCGRSFLRSASYWLSAVLGFAGFLWSLQSDQGETWHDLLAGTLVIEDDKMS